MRNLTHRVERLERQKQAKAEAGVLVIFDGMPPARKTSDEYIDPKSLHRGLSKERCIEILRECGYINNGPWISFLNLHLVPRGLSAADTERWLRERGREACGGNR